MAQPLIGFGIALIVLGLVAFFATGMGAVTALIPTFFGIVIAGLGAAALNDRFRTPAVYGSLALGALGFLGSISGIPPMIRYLNGDDVARPAASIAQSMMALITLAMIVMLAKGLLSKDRAG